MFALRIEGKCHLRRYSAYRDDAIDVDTGLRFPEPDENGVSCCPGCGGKVKGEWL